MLAHGMGGPRALSRCPHETWSRPFWKTPQGEVWRTQPRRGPDSRARIFLARSGNPPVRQPESRRDSAGAHTPPYRLPGGQYWRDARLQILPGAKRLTRSAFRIRKSAAGWPPRPAPPRPAPPSGGAPARESRQERNPIEFMITPVRHTEKSDNIRILYIYIIG